jgi:hypothetical protein
MVEKKINEKLYEINELLASCRKSTLRKLLTKVKGYPSTNCEWIGKWAQDFTERLIRNNISIIDRKQANK